MAKRNNILFSRVRQEANRLDRRLKAKSNVQQVRDTIDDMTTKKNVIKAPKPVVMVDTSKGPKQKNQNLSFAPFMAKVKPEAKRLNTQAKQVSNVLNTSGTLSSLTRKVQSAQAQGELQKRKKALAGSGTFNVGMGDGSLVVAPVSEERQAQRRALGMDKEAAKEAEDLYRNHRVLSGFISRWNTDGTDAYEKAMEREYGITQGVGQRAGQRLRGERETQNGIDYQTAQEAKNSGAYKAGQILGDVAWYAGTAPVYGLLGEAGAGARGFRGGLRALRNRTAAETLINTPVNMIVSLNEADSWQDFIKEFGINEALDFALGGIFNVPGITKNVHLNNARALRDAGDIEGAVRELGKVNFKHYKDIVRNLTGDELQQVADSGVRGSAADLANRTLRERSDAFRDVVRARGGNNEAVSMLPAVERRAAEREAAVTPRIPGRDQVGNSRMPEGFYNIRGRSDIVPDGNMRIGTDVRAPREEPGVRNYSGQNERREALIRERNEIINSIDIANTSPEDFVTGNYLPPDQLRRVEEIDAELAAMDNSSIVREAEPEPVTKETTKGRGKEPKLEDPTEQRVYFETGVNPDNNRGPFAIFKEDGKYVVVEGDGWNEVDIGTFDKFNDARAFAKSEYAKGTTKEGPQTPITRADLETVNKDFGKKYGKHSGGLTQGVETAEGVKATNKTYDTIRKNLSDEVKYELDQGVLRGYDNVRDGVTTEELIERVAKNFDNDPVAYAKDLINGKSDISAKERLVGLDSAQTYFRDAGDVNMEREVAEAYAQMVEDSASLMSVHRIIQRMSRGGRENYFNKAIENFEKAHARQLKKAGIEHFVIPDEIKQACLNAKTEKEIEDAWSALSMVIWNQTPASIKEKIDFVRINAMLLNPKTHLRNIMGNTIFAPIREIKNIIGTGLEAGAEKAGLLAKDNRQKALLINRSTSENMKYADSVFKVKEKELRGTTKYYENRVASGRPSDLPTFMAGKENGNSLVNIFRRGADKAGLFNSKLLDLEDVVGMRGAFDVQFTRIMNARGLTPAMLEADAGLRAAVTEDAAEEALRATYRDSSWMASQISRLKNVDPNSPGYMRAVGLALDSILPFSKTPINILRRAADYSPLGLIRTTERLANFIKTGDQKALVTALDRMSSTLTGAGIFGVGYLMAQNNNLVARLGDDKEGRYMRDVGNQNFSLVLGDGDSEKSITLDWAVPACIPLFSGVAFHNALQDGISLWEIGDVLEKVFDPSMEMSVMQGISDTLDTFSREGGLQGVIDVGVNTALNYAGQFNPTILRQLARTIDPVRRDTTSTAESPLQRTVQRWANRQISGLPWASKTLQPYKNVWGETQYNGGALENFITPWYTKDHKEDEVDKEIQRVYGRNPNNDDTLPAKYNKYSLTLDGEQKQMSPENRTNYIEVYGTTSHDNLRKLFKTDAYKNASMTEQEKMIKDVYEDASIRATQDTLVKMGEDPWKVYTDTFSGKKKDEYPEKAKAAGITPEEYYEYASTKDWDKDGNGYAKKAEAIEYVNGLDISGEQKAVVFSLISSAKNPYGPGVTTAAYSGSGGRRSGGGYRRSGGSSKKGKSAKTPTIKAAKAIDMSKVVRASSGLSKSQKKALIKLIQKRIEV